MEMPASDISDISDMINQSVLDISDEKPPEIESSPTDLEVGPNDYKDQEEDIDKDKVIVKDPDLSASDIKIITQDQDPYQSMTVSELKETFKKKGYIVIKPN